jgi:hypothetical protein
LVQQRLVLPGRVAQHLAQEVIDGLARVGGRVPLRRLDARHLERQDELGHLDREAAADAADARLGGEVDVEAVLEEGEVAVRERGRRRELGQREGERRLLRGAEVDRGKRHAARRHVGHAGDGLLGRGAGYAAGERVGRLGRLRGEGLVADEEAGLLLAGLNRA